jgi:GNAT superfamily N-acetyltransferase
MPLNNPIYQALTSSDAHLNQGNDSVAFFPENLAPFIGLPNWNPHQQQELLLQAPPHRAWFLIHQQPVQFIDAFKTIFSIPLYQMTCNQLLPAPPSLEKPVPLGLEHIEEMIALTSLTKPGPFLERTIEFGNYHGIFSEGKLVAMGGERMHVNQHTEISAICTHPDFQGRGYGAQMVHFLTNLILEKGQMPFLHARIDNKKALDVYERLGYKIRTEMFFAIFKRKDQP